MRRRVPIHWLSALAIVAISSGVSWAYFTSVGSGTTAGSVTSLSAPAITGATPGPGSVALTWGAVTPPGSGAVSYYLTRDGGASGGNCPSSASPSSVTSCTDSGLAPGTYSYRVTVVWRTWTATSSSTNVTVNTGVATQLSLSAASTTPIAGVADNLTITAKDVNGNTATGYTGSHSLTFGGAADAPSGTHPTVTTSSGIATNFGTATAISFTNGVASVTGSNNGVMKLYKAEAATVTVTDGTISNGAGTSVTVGPAAASKLAFAQQPGGATGGSVFTTQPKVAVQDPYANTVTTDTSNVTLAIGTNPGAGTLSCTANPVAASAGVASFAGCKIDKIGTGYTLKATDGVLTLATSATFNVTVGVPTKLTFTQQPSSSTGGVSFTTQPKVAVQDAGGNTVTTDTSGVTLAIGTNPGGGTLACTTNPLAAVAGVASFAGCKIDKPGTGYTLTATDGSLTSATSNALNITVGPAAKLAFTQQPSGATGGTAFTTQPKVAVLDAGGNTVTTDASNVTLAIGTNPGAGTLTCGTNPQAASSGEASFAGCKIDKIGTGYTLKATDGSLTLATSTTFNVTVGPAAKLGFTQQVAGAKAGIAFTTQPKVAVQDAGGNTVTTDTSSVTLAIGTNPAGGTLTCTANPLAATAGVASFAGCKIDNPATGYTLTATDGSLTSATSASFEVTPPPLWVANGATTTWTTNTAGTVALPASLSVNDLMLLIVANTANNTITTAPTGWTSVQTVGSSLGAGVRLTVYRKLYAVTDTAPSVTPNADTGGASARIAAFRYVNTTTPLDVTAATSSSAAGAATFTPTGQTTVTTNARAESIVAENSGGPLTPTLGFGTSQGFSFESGFPEAGTVGDLTNNHAVGLAGLPKPTAGAVTFPTFSTSSSVPALGIWAGISIALRP
jgi:trimeric autotransporter adhesin